VRGEGVYGTPTTAARPPARGCYLSPRLHVGAVLQQRPHHHKMPVPGGDVQAGRRDLEIRCACRQRRCHDKCGLGRRRRSPAGGTLHAVHAQVQDTAAGSRRGTLLFYAPNTPEGGREGEGEREGKKAVYSVWDKLLYSVWDKPLRSVWDKPLYTYAHTLDVEVGEWECEHLTLRLTVSFAAISAPSAKRVRTAA